MLKRTALYDEHVRAGGRLIDFGGWELPVQYAGVIAEHQACRSAGGLFDVSHMGEITVEGADAAAYLDYLVTNRPSSLALGQAQYTALCHESGGLVDDLVIYRRAQDRFFVVVNASNTDKDFAHFQKVLAAYAKKAGHSPNVALKNVSAEYSQIALQGRIAEKLLQPLTSVSLQTMKTYWFGEGQVLGGIPALIGRTGYTGEDGFEIYVPWAKGPEVWRALLEAGAPLGLKPCGLGARDTLRLEMKYALYGNELTDQTHPFEAGLGWVVKMDKPDFVGKEALLAIKSQGITRKLVGLKLLERGIPRHGYPVKDAQGRAVIGEVTSGTQSPSLGQALAIAYVEAAHASLGQELAVEIRGAPVRAQVIATPFYQRPY